MRTLWTMNILFVPGSNWWSIWHVFVCCEFSEPPRTHQGSIYLQQTTSLTQGSSSGRHTNAQNVGFWPEEAQMRTCTHMYVYTHRWPWRWAPPYPGPLAELLCAPAGCWAPPAAGGAWSAVGSAPRAAHSNTQRGEKKSCLTDINSTHPLTRTTGANTMLVFSVLTSEKVPTFDMWLGETEHSAPTRSSNISKPILTLRSHCWPLCV